MDKTTLLALMAVVSVSHQNQPIEIQEGHDLSLECPEQTHTNLENYTWDWKRDYGNTTNHANSVIFSHRNGRDHPQPQMEQYRNRAFVDREDLRRGLLTLQITSVQQADSGWYKCSIRKLNTSHTVTVVVKKDNGTSGKHDFGPTTPTVGGRTDPVEKKRNKVITIVVLAVLGVFLIITIAGVVLWEKCNFKMSRGSRGQDEHYELGVRSPAKKDKNDAAANGVKPADML